MPTYGGSKCRRCGANEQHCALNYGACCASCTHWLHYDGAGNPKVSAPPLPDDRAICLTCKRRVSPRGRFDCPGLCAEARRAYDRESYRRRVS